ncbi:MAG: endopeptidase La [Ruminococcaceae bacterium]|nr:endopeptidase La [Oscillospiraceae bacterium]
MSQYIEKAEKLALPLITLRDTVAFPGALLNFELTDESDIRAAKAASATSGLVFLVTEKPRQLAEQLVDLIFHDEELDDDLLDSPIPKLYPVGAVVRIKQMVQTPDKQFRVIFEGCTRATLLTADFGGDFATAEVMSKTVMLGDVNDLHARAYLHTLMESLRGLSKYLPSGSEEMLHAAAEIRDPGQLADFIAANVLIKTEDKQETLECYEPFKRVDLVLSLIETEGELLECASDIQRKVHARMARNQKEFYLREQIRVIQDELGDGANAETERYERRIRALHLPEEIEQKLLKENERLAKTPFGSSEAGVITTYLDTVLELPWNKKTKDRIDVAAAKKILDEDHDGLDKVKDRILEYLAVKQMHPELKNQVLCLVGAPGVGKTSVAASIARAMKRKYVRVSLGGIRDEADIRGHRKTYLGSMPGRIMAALAQSGSSNPLILLDEIDKMTQSAQGDPASALLEVLDGEQNKTFRDHYIELPYDLSDCLFIATANTLDTVPRPLIDRMEIIEMQSYTKREKINIAKNHLIPKQLKRHGLTRAKFRLSDEAIVELIDYYTHEAGVRNLERTIASLIRKAVRKMLDEGKKSVRIDAHHIKDYLGCRKLLPEKIDEIDEIGTVNGLAYTELGGDMLKVEVAALEGTGKLELTGSLGDVMQESAKAALSYTRSIASQYGIPTNFYQKKDIHIHVPEGAVPKDGPSAGVTMLTALVSALTGRPVRHDVAMTGEITLRGRVLPIGGLREKTMAAYSAGVKTVLIPADNERDLENIDPLARENLTFIPCRVADDVLKNALL